MKARGGPSSQSGEWIRLDAGELDIGFIVDLGQHYGERWRPWKRHLHRRWLPVPRFVRRWFGWRPLPNNFSMFLEEWQASAFVDPPGES